jgi:hypothetical protein
MGLSTLQLQDLRLRGIGPPIVQPGLSIHYESADVKNSERQEAMESLPRHRFFHSATSGLPAPCSNLNHDAELKGWRVARPDRPAWLARQPSPVATRTCAARSKTAAARRKPSHTKADDIVRKWIDFFVLHKRITSEVLTRRVR